jgi:hypothetical protein
LGIFPGGGKRGQASGTLAPTALVLRLFLANRVSSLDD